LAIFSIFLKFSWSGFDIPVPATNNCGNVVDHCPFEEVLYLDSDCYPVTDVTDLFGHNPHGAIFWPNLAFTDHFIRWHVYGTGPSGRPPIQGGQYLLHKRKCWGEILLAHWWNERADYSYCHGYGDEDVLRGVWQQRGKEFTMFQQRPQWDRVAYVFAGPDGHRPALVHRPPDKFRLPLLELKCHIPSTANLYRQWTGTAETTYQPGLPGEDLAFTFFREFRQRFFDHDPGRYRPETDDRLTWETIVHQNVYRLPEHLPAGSSVVDVGGQIGSFAHAACRRGAARVLVFEPNPDTFARLTRNLAYWGSRITARQQAVWSRTGLGGQLPGRNRDAGCVGPAEDGAPAVAIDDVLAEASAGGTQPVYLIKLDCAGAEWPILFAARDLSPCRQIVGKYHVQAWDGQLRGPTDLCRILTRHGFTVRTEPLSDALGLFWAVREVNR
jgi:FkbM family methyltransferase